MVAVVFLSGPLSFVTWCFPANDTFHFLHGYTHFSISDFNISAIVPSPLHGGLMGLAAIKDRQRPFFQWQGHCIYVKINRYLLHLKNRKRMKPLFPLLLASYTTSFYRAYFFSCIIRGALFGHFLSTPFVDMILSRLYTELIGPECPPLGPPSCIQEAHRHCYSHAVTILLAITQVFDRLAPLKDADVSERS